MRIYRKKKLKKYTGNWKKVKIISAVFAALLLTACQGKIDNGTETLTKETMTEFTWEKQDYSGLEYNSSYFTYPDDFRIYSVATKMDMTSVGNRKYGFQTEISDEERAACIEATEIILGRIGFDGELDIYIYTEEAANNSYYIDEKSGKNVFLAYGSDWDSPDYVAGLILAVYGKYVNYGAAHGYADYLCDDVADILKSVVIGYQQNNINVIEDMKDDTEMDNEDNYHGEDDTEIGEVDNKDNQHGKSENELNYENPVFNAEYNCYDLNLLCFDDDFVTEDEKREANAVSDAFVREYIEKNGEQAFRELLQKSGNLQTCGEFNGELEKWYNDNGLMLSEPLSEVLYTYGGYSYQYIAYNGYVNFHMKRDWQDVIYDRNPLVTENFLHEDYAETKKFYEINTKQMRQYKELFKLDSDVMDIPAVMLNAKESYTSLKGAKSKIYIANVSSLMHEYIHALCMPTSLPDFWAVEGWARAFDSRYDYYAYDFLTLYYNNVAQNDEKWSFFNELIDRNSRPIDMETDYRDVDNLIIYFGQHYDPYYSYGSGASFIYYLCDTYGERKIIDYVCDNHDLTTFTDKTYEELVEDWKNYMEEAYSWCSRENR